MNKVKIIAEIGCNHKGDIQIAKDLIKSAKLCGADIAKFQKRTPKELLTPEQYNAPHPNPANSYGATYGEHREFLEFNADQHKELKDYCDDIGIEYSTSVWDITSAKAIVPLNPHLIKIPSAVNNNERLLKWLCENYGGEIHVSLGMTTRKEEDRLIRLFEDEGRAKDVVVYSCTSGYPVAFEDICLLEINRIRAAYESKVKGIGFSGLQPLRLAQNGLNVTLRWIAHGKVPIMQHHLNRKGLQSWFAIFITSRRH